MGGWPATDAAGRSLCEECGTVAMRKREAEARAWFETVTRDASVDAPLDVVEVPDAKRRRRGTVEAGNPLWDK